MAHQHEQNMQNIHPLNWASHYSMIELPIDVSQAAQTKITFPDQPNIRYARILGVEIYTANDLAVTQPSSYPLITPAQMLKCTLVLECNDADIITGAERGNKAGRFTATQQNFQYLPFSTIHYIQDSVPTPFNRYRLWFPDTFVTWQKSYVQIANGGLGNTGTVAVGIGVLYTWLTIDNQLIDRT